MEKKRVWGTGHEDFDMPYYVWRLRRADEPRHSGNMEFASDDGVTCDIGRALRFDNRDDAVKLAATLNAKE